MAKEGSTEKMREKQQCSDARNVYNVVMLSILETSKPWEARKESLKHLSVKLVGYVDR